MIYKEILEEAIQLVGGTRNKDYGDRLTNHQHIAGLWSIFLGKKISPHDVAICMVLVKIARLINKHKRDSYVDMAAYSSIAAEIEARTTKDISFESEGERKGRMTQEYIAGLNKNTENK
jgi:hypothetical protein|tara:strand:- start:1171 stop:1527 length:357 start_codon:yes stop_codon:yes gene_type:complete